MALIRGVGGLQPQVDEDAFLAETAVLVGDVHVSKGASIWYNTVLRADIGQPVRIGENSNIQDNCVLHTVQTLPTVIGDWVTLGHGAIVHSAVIGDFSLIGMGALVLDGAEVGHYSVIGAHALVPAGKVIPPYSLAMGSPARVVRTLSAEEAENYLQLAKNYCELWRTKYK